MYDSFKILLTITLTITITIFEKTIIFFPEKSFLYQILAESLSKVTNSCIKFWENPQFDRLSSHLFGGCYKLSDWWIKLSALNMIG